MVSDGMDAVSDFVGGLYEAAYDESHWPIVMEEMRLLFAGSKACFARLGPDLNEIDSVSTDYDPAFQILFIDQFSDACTLMGLVNTLPLGHIYHDHQLFGRDRLRASRFFNEWMAPQDMYGGLACKVNAVAGSSWFVDVQRGRNQAPFAEEDWKLFELIRPHFLRSARIRQAFQKNRLMSQAYSALPCGVVLVDRGMRLLETNAFAETILSARDDLFDLRRGIFRVRDAGRDNALREIVARICTPGHDLSRRGSDALLIQPAKPGREAIAVSVTPLRRHQDTTPSLSTPAALFIRDVNPGLTPGFAERLQALFGLTPKEAEIAAALASGRTLKEAAADGKIAFSTARSYLEHVFDKTETRKQGQLIALLRGTGLLERQN